MTEQIEVADLGLCQEDWAGVASFKCMRMAILTGICVPQVYLAWHLACWVT
jgi:hypothetical protein